MKIRKYFYSEYKKKLDKRWKELGAVLEAQKKTDFQAVARRTGRNKGTEYGGDPAVDGGSDAPAVRGVHLHQHHKI